MTKKHIEYVEELHKMYPDIDKKWIYEITKNFLQRMVNYGFDNEGFYTAQRQWFMHIPTSRYKSDDAIFQRVVDLQEERNLKKKLKKYVR